MKLTKEQANKLKDVDIVEASHKAREEATHLLNDQGLTVLSLAVSKSTILGEILRAIQSKTPGVNRFCFS